MSSGKELQDKYEIRPDTQGLTQNADPSMNSKTGVDYEPHGPGIPISAEHKHVVDSITRLYSGSASEQDMQVYAEKAVYDDPWSYCDTRYKIAGQWYGIPKLFNSQTLATEIVEDTPTSIIWKQTQKYEIKGVKLSRNVNSLITLTLDEQTGKVKFHKDQWNEKDYSHEGLGKVMKTLNGDHLTKITQPEDSL